MEKCDALKEIRRSEDVMFWNENEETNDLDQIPTKMDYSRHYNINSGFLYPRCDGNSHPRRYQGLVH